MKSRHLLVLVVVLALLAPLGGGATPAAAEDAPLTAVFDWFRPARLVDAPPIDGLLNFHNDASLAQPTGYTVRLLGCDSTPIHFEFEIELDEEDLIRVLPSLGDPPANPIVKIDWAVTGGELAAPILLSVDATAGCSADVVLPQGTYNVTMTVTAEEGQTAQTTGTFYVKDYLIAAMGDSYGSGEGNPVIPGRYNVANPYDVIEATWNDRRCHRSQYAGAAQAAKEIEAADRKTSVTFVFVSCSGATIDEGLVGYYKGAVPPDGDKYALLDPQVKQVRDIVGNRQIDALIISIGGNDVNFAGIASECFLNNECPSHKENDRTLDERFRSDVTVKLPGEYKRLNDAITEAGLNIRNTYITEYPDPTRKDTYDDSLRHLVAADRISEGNYCAAILYDILPPVDSSFSAPRLGYADGELSWASGTVLTMLNQAVANAAEAHGWHFVTGIAAEFLKGHGYCAGQNWIRTAEESVNMQGPWMNKPGSIGTLHPTREGHQVYKRQILDAIQPDLGLPEMPGNRVVVQPIDGTTGGTPVELTFDNLISAGDTTLATGDSGPAAPAGYIAANPPMYYNLESTARFSGEVQLCITYISTAWNSEDMLRLFHYRGDTWVDETFSLDAANDVICGRTTTFSPFAIFAMNRVPTVDAGGPYTVNEGSPLTLDGTAGDLDGHALTYAWTAATHLNDGASEDPTYTAPDNGVETLTLRATDPLGLSAEDMATVTVNNVAPVATLDAPASVAEGTAFTISLLGAADPSSTDTAAGFTYAFDCGTGYGVPGPVASAMCPAVDDGTLTVKGRIGDKDGGVTEYTRAVQVANVAPTVVVGTPLEGALFAVNDPVNVTASFTDPGSADTHTCAITWDDGSTTAGSVEQSAGTCSASHAFTQAGVYTLSIVVTDDDGGTGTARVMVVVYDPSAGFVTGGGWIASPAGAYVADPTLQGKATFGFVSKYQKGATTPVGHTEFQFQAGGFKFTSTRYEWLVVSGAKGQYKGEGAVNGVQGYGFLLTATDGQRTGGGGVDKFRIKVWDGTGATVYDNKIGASEDIDAADPQEIGGGSIVIHVNK